MGVAAAVGILGKREEGCRFHKSVVSYEVFPHGHADRFYAVGKKKKDRPMAGQSIS